jgi:hypothetical protein
MATEEIVVTTAVAVGGYVGTKLFGAALSTMGDDINKLYSKGRDKIVEIATKKVVDPEDGQQVNLRAARDVVWNGAITDDEVCAEYFGGMLAAARSVDGKDDGVVHYVDTIKAMSARQLELHYVIYKAWQTLLMAEQSPINVGQGSEVQAKRIFLAGMELASRALRYDLDLTVLNRQGLVSSFRYDTVTAGEKAVPYVEIAPTVFGVMLFAVAHNKLDSWRAYAKESYESAAGIKPVQAAAPSLEKLNEA